jgi:protein phosphatase
VRNALLTVVLLALLAAGGYGAYQWSQRQYYVGAEGRNVAIFRGLTQDVGPLHTSKVYERQDIVLADLPTYQRERVQADITANDLRDAERIVATLREQAEICRRAAASASATPTAAPSPSSSGSPSATAGRSPTPTPAASSTPSPAPTDPAAIDCGDGS